MYIVHRLFCCVFFYILSNSFYFHPYLVPFWRWQWQRWRHQSVIIVTAFLPGGNGGCPPRFWLFIQHHHHHNHFVSARQIVMQCNSNISGARFFKSAKINLCWDLTGQALNKIRAGVEREKFITQDSCFLTTALWFVNLPLQIYVFFL